MPLVSESTTALASRIACGDISSREALQAFFDRVDALDPRVNAIVTQAREGAMAEARAADRALAEGAALGPLHGVPMTVKDTFDVAGLRTTNGLPWLRKNVPSGDADCVALLRAAGAIVWAKTSLPFASYDWNCNHPLIGACRNPWSPSHGPGGSSGGSAAALAAGFTPLELGSDVAGSIRHPSHCCGVYGLRTSEGALSTRGHGASPGSPRALRHHLVVGPMARHPEDLRLALPILLESTERGRWMKQRAEPAKPLSQTKIAWTPTWGDIPLCRDTERVLGETMRRLEASGAEVHRIDLPFDLMHAYEVYGVTHSFEFAAVLPSVLRTVPGRRLMRHVYHPFKYRRGVFTRNFGLGLTASPHRYFEMLEAREALVERFERWFQNWDLWVTPVAATTAFPLGKFNRSVRIEGRRVPYGDVVGTFCVPTAALAHPIASVPAGMSERGLPIGLQLHARRWHDLQLVDWICQLADHLPQPRLACD
ncbi:MAG: amidase [Acidobacteriota bacterium]